jgi:hypothetical protein
MDHRDVAARKENWWDKLDEKRMVATATVWDDDGDGVEVEVAFRWEVCPTCEGRGKHVNPSIDSQGISPEEFDEEPDFHEDYMRGVYDVSCYECGGRRVVPEPDEDTENGKRVVEKMNTLAQWAREEAHEREMGY